jgi:hypothetical protein
VRGILRVRVVLGRYLYRVTHRSPDSRQAMHESSLCARRVRTRRPAHIEALSLPPSFGPVARSTVPDAAVMLRC